MTRQTVDVVGVGSATWNRFVVVPRFPEPGDKIRALHLDESAGGSVATSLVALQRWGLRSRFIGTFGTDSISDQILDDLKIEQIDISYVSRHPEIDGRSDTVLVDNRTGQRCVIHGPSRTLPFSAKDLSDNAFKGARVLLLDTSLDDSVIELARRARSLGLWVTMDAEYVGKHAISLMKECDYIIASGRFAREFTDQQKLDLAAYSLHLQTDRPVVVMDGANGCEYASVDLCFHQKAYDVPVVDGTGAGDVFHAAFIYSLLSALDPRRTLRFANWAAGMSCRELGGRKGIPTEQAVREFLHTHH